METTVKQRLINYLKYKKISQRKFELEIGLSNGYVNNINKSIQPDKIQKIILCYSDLNTGWLLTGEGEMLKGGDSSHASPPRYGVCEDCREKDKVIAKLKDETVSRAMGHSNIKQTESYARMLGKKVVSDMLKLTKHSDPIP